MTDELKEATKTYLSKASSLLKKYSSYNKDGFASFHDGSIAVSMLIDDNIPLEIIEKVLSESSISKAKDAAYVRNIAGSLKKIQDIYKKINDAQGLESVSSGQDIYYILAKRYMAMTKTKLLSSRDDEAIAKMLLKNRLSPKQTESILEKASPVAAESGRDKTKYAVSIMELAKESLSKEASCTTGEVETAFLVLSLKYSEEKLNETPSRINQLICRNLLQKYPAPKILMVLKKNAVPLPEKIMLAAKKSLLSENAIIYANENISQNAEKNLADLYRLAIKERLKTYPSVIFKLTSLERDIDERAAEKLINKYPALDLIKFTEMIALYSPIAVLEDNPFEYAKEIVNGAKKRLKESEVQYSDVKQEYSRHVGFIAEGVTAEQKLTMYLHGRAALRMLMNQTEAEAVKAAIIAVADTDGDKNEYAENIVRCAEEVQRRIIELEEAKNSPPRKSEDEYKCELYELYKKKKFMQTSMDIEAAKSLLKKGTPSGSIREIIHRCSPLAAEAGRDKDYAAFIDERARESLRQEKEKERPKESVKEKTTEKVYVRTLQSAFEQGGIS